MTKVSAWVCVLLAAPCFAAHAAPEPDPTEVQQITQAEDRWREARIKGDLAFLQTFYADDVRIQGMNGGSMTKAEDMAMFSSGDLKPKFIKHGPLDIRVFGETAIVTGVDDLGGSYKGHCGEMSLRFLDVLVKRDGRWQLLVQQATLVRPKP